MTLRKKTIDNSVIYVTKDSNSRSEYSPEDFKPKSVSNPRKQNKKLSQNNRKYSKNITGEELRIIKWIMNCYF